MHIPTDFIAYFSGTIQNLNLAKHKLYNALVYKNKCEHMITWELALKSKTVLLYNGSYNTLIFYNRIALAGIKKKFMSANMLFLSCLFPQNLNFFLQLMILKYTHKCFKCWWLALPDKKRINKPLINSTFNHGLHEGPS